MITYNLRKPEIKSNAFSNVGVTGENKSFTARFLIKELVDTELSFSIHLRFSDGSVNTVIPDEVKVDDTGTTIIWNVKKTDIFIHGYFEMQIEGRKSDGYVFQTEIVRMYADESISVEENDYKNPNSETLKLREEAYELLCELKLQQGVLDENMRQLLATDITRKVDKTAFLLGFDGSLNFDLYSNFVRANVKSSDGSLDTNVKYRVTSEDIMKFDYDLNVSVDSGFTAYVVKYVDGKKPTIKSLSDTNGWVIPANTEFRLHIRRNPENTAETADINEFVNAVKFQTKTGADIIKVNSDIVKIGKDLNVTNNSLMGELPLKWLQGNVPPLGGGAGNRIIAVLGSMEQPFTISWTDDNRVVKVWGYDSDTYGNRTQEISVSSGDTVVPTQGIYYAIVCRTEDSAVIKPVYGENVTVNVAFRKIEELDGRIKTVEDKLTAQRADTEIPDYYYENNYLPNKIDEIKNACSILHGVTFAFITDIHLKMNQGQSKKLLKKILDETNVPFVIFGGDIVYLEGTEEELHEQVAQFNEFKSVIGRDRLFCTRGNHDLYNATNPASETDRVAHNLKTTDVYDTLFRDSERSVTSMSVNNGCYCIDNEPQKTRIIMLNTSDVSDNIDYEGGGVSFRASTLQWLSAVLTEKEGYKIIIVCHTPLNYEKFGNDNPSENPDGLQEMVQAFKNKTTFTTTRFNVEVNADFTKTNNELICVISGHRHIDGSSVENNVLNMVTTCDCIDKKDGYGRKAGTISEQAFDVVCINYDTKKINTVRMGAGENREYNI